MRAPQFECANTNEIKHDIHLTNTLLTLGNNMFCWFTLALAFDTVINNSNQRSRVFEMKGLSFYCNSVIFCI